VTWVGRPDIHSHDTGRKIAESPQIRKYAAEASTIERAEDVVRRAIL
jgi:hypothetical protein